MKVVCEKCQSEYSIDDNRIPATGLKIKCPKCMHAFVVNKGDGAPATPPGPHAQDTVAYAEAGIGSGSEIAGAALPPDSIGFDDPTRAMDLDLDLDLPDPMAAPSASDGFDAGPMGAPGLADSFDLDSPPPAPASQPGAFEIPPATAPDFEPVASLAGHSQEAMDVDTAFADIFAENVPAPGGSRPAAAASVSAVDGSPEDGHVDLFSGSPEDEMAGLDDLMGGGDAGMEVIDYDQGGQKEEVHYRIRRDGDNVFGPYSAESVIRMIREQKLKGNEEVSTDEATWVPLGSTPEFAEILLEMVREGAGAVLDAPEADKKTPRKSKKKKKDKPRKVITLGKRALPVRAIATVLVVLALGGGGAYAYLYTDLLDFGGDSVTDTKLTEQIVLARAEITQRTPDALEAAMRRLRQVEAEGNGELRTQAKSLRLLALAEKIEAGIDVNKTRKAADSLYADLTGSEPNDSDFFKAKGLYLLLSDDQAGARQALEMAISREERDVEAHYIKARMFFRANDSGRAKEALAMALKIQPAHAPSLFFQGEIELKANKPDAAAVTFAKALTANADHVPSLIGQARLLIASEQTDAALKNLDRVRSVLSRKASPRQLAEAHNLAGNLYLAARRFNEAESALGSAVSLERDNLKYHLDFGDLCLRVAKPKKALEEFKFAERLDPKSIGALIGVARAMLMDDNAVQANLKLTDAKQQAGKDPRLHYWIGRTSEALLQEDKAIIAFQNAIQLGPKFLDPYVALARLYLRHNQGEQARKVLERIKTFAEDSPEADNSFGELEAWEKHFDRAEASFRKALQTNPDFVDARLNLANVLRDTGRYDAAGQEYIEVFKREPQLGRAHYEYALSFQKQSHYTEAVQEYIKAGEMGFRNAVSLGALGSAYYMAKDLANAEKILLSAVEEDSRNTTVHYYLGRVYLDQKDLEKSLYHFRETLAWKPDDCDAHFWLGVTWERKDTPRDAIDQYEETTRLCPRYIDAYLHLGAVYRRENHIDKSVKNYREALRIDDTRGDIFVEIGLSYELLQKSKEAVNFYNKALKIQPENCEAWKALGKVHVASEKRKEAVKAFSTAIRHCPNDCVSHRFLGYLYKDMNQLAKARRMFEQYLKCEPDAEDAGDIKDEIHHLKQD